MLSSAFSYLYRSRCAGCDIDVEGPGMCQPCFDTLVPSAQGCLQCARTITGRHALYCRECSSKKLALSRLYVPFDYGGQLEVALKRLKYSRRADVARALAPLLQPRFDEASASADFVCAVPLHRARLARRGYNQAERLAHHLGAANGCAGALVRPRPTSPQAGLSARERAANVKDAFQCRRARLKGARVLLVDDVVTTGSTLFSAAKALRQAGAADVIGFCAARACR
jgi:ComF family protein